MERSLALMCGAGPLPARMAGEARQQGWRVVAFVFAEAPGIDAAADVVIPSRITEAAAVLAALAGERVSAALFSGKFWMSELVRGDAAEADAAALALERRAGARTDTRLAGTVFATLAGMGIDVLDQRRFIGDWLAGEGPLTARGPADEAWKDVREGLAVARTLAAHGVGQTVVIKHGVVTAVEAVEGTSETIRRGTRLAGPGAAVVKIVAPGHDYRMDLPAIGPETVNAAAAGGAAVIAVAAGRVLVLDRAEALARAETAGVALVGVSDGGDG